MKKTKIKSYCKINLTLRVIKKLNNGYHEIKSLITFCDLFDMISISKTYKTKDEINFFGRFKKNINEQSNTITKALHLLRKKKLIKNESYKISVIKNIPHGSGLGGGSSNAATILNYFNKKTGSKLSNSKMEKLAGQIGFDVPIVLKKKNTMLIGRKDKILRLKQRFNLNILIVYPNLICSTKEIYKSNKNINLNKIAFLKRNKKDLINYLKREKNDLEDSAVAIYPKIKKIINFIKSQKGCYLSRITGSGSACIGVFSNMRNAITAMKLIKLKHPRYWCVVSKTI
ncbi:MAG: 4-diphosphocytidyl-2-C-methyl-D-erythritol kinase [Pelagibacterales bacterium]|nr:4-diphosphocytidyl-2-C-methyl-D-erythritol kinase [Pelagibacterales bacterium]